MHGSNPRVRVVLADDHPLMLAGLRAALAEEPALHVVAEAADGEEAVCLALSTSPDLVILSLALPRMNGVDATRRLQSAGAPPPKVLAHCPPDAPAQARAAALAGAAACLPRRCRSDELLAAVHACLRETPPRPVPSAPPRRRAPGQRDVFDVLTEREREVLQLVAEGWSIKEIARRLSVSRKTVETHRRRLGEKLGISSVAGLTKYAIGQGLTSVDRFEPAPGAEPTPPVQLARRPTTAAPLPDRLGTELEV